MRAARLAAAVARRRAAAADPQGEAARIARLPADRLAAGPANLAAAFGVERRDNGIDLLDPAGSLRLEPGRRGDPVREIVAAARVGVAYAGPGWADRPWRFVAGRASTRAPVT
jgi:DNA-3-methyladenine glycosylase